MLETFTVTVTMNVQAENAVGAGVLAFQKLPLETQLVVHQPDGEILTLQIEDVIACDSCGSLYHRNDIERQFPNIPDLAERLDPGGMVPFGECPDPECGCLVYPALATMRAKDYPFDK